MRIIEDMRTILDSYDAFLQRVIKVSLFPIIASRRVLQHQALSLPTSSDAIYNLCRLAVITFLVESLEPLPSRVSYHDKASRGLMLLIDECDKLGYWQMRPELMLWATILGGFTARENSLRWWYSEQLRSSPIPTTTDRWVEVQSRSEHYLPFKHHHGEMCRQFWDESCSWLSVALA
jgi:hypothetical protein